jgi:hypothetical protein
MMMVGRTILLQSSLLPLKCGAMKSHGKCQGITFRWMSQNLYNTMNELNFLHFAAFLACWFIGMAILGAIDKNNRRK